MREPDFPIGTVSRGKIVSVGKNQKFKVGDYNFPKLLVISNAILVHSLPEEDHKKDGEDSECNKYIVGKWYSGKVFYSVKDMRAQGTSAFLGGYRIKHGKG